MTDWVGRWPSHGLPGRTWKRLGVQLQSAGDAATFDVSDRKSLSHFLDLVENGCVAGAECPIEAFHLGSERSRIGLGISRAMVHKCGGVHFDPMPQRLLRNRAERRWQALNETSIRERTKLILVDDHAMFREALVRLLEKEPNIEVVGRSRLGSGSAVHALRERSHHGSAGRESGAEPGPSIRARRAKKSFEEDPGFHGRHQRVGGSATHRGRRRWHPAQTSFSGGFARDLTGSRRRVAWKRPNLGPFSARSKIRAHRGSLAVDRALKRRSSALLPGSHEP